MRHWHLPWSRRITSRFTFAGTEDFRLCCWRMKSSRAERRISSSVALGRTWDSPALALFSNATSSGDAVMCIRTDARESGWMVVRSTIGPIGGRTPAGWVRSSSTGWTIAVAITSSVPCAFAVCTVALVTTVLVGACSTGWISATTCFASWRDRWKNLGSTSPRFSSVITLASSMTLVMQSRPSRSGSSTSGNFRTRRAPTCR
ncbi:MAG TPA: hypothetical protein VFM45_11315 [Anaeromyxobacteraceae bacterium]|nr:hypothetical protein [Anaeromyxobacteraceae bacterium]